ncbi:MAG: TIGR02710 family CRISPR-associated protein [Bryobacterales bacterium]|nr:TIGR02710 family CRISPR-associated protein [Bryobacterales bacterium]
MSNPDRAEGMIVSVGGSPDPIRVSLSKARPRVVLFVVSRGSQKQVEEKILPELGFHVVPNYCVVADENQLDRIYAELRRQIRDWLRLNLLTPEKVLIDFTGGTKPMSAGLALAALEDFHTFCYVSGHRRDKEGLGSVQSGSEYLVHTANPWEVEAVKARERASFLFSAGQVAEAAELLRRASKKCSLKTASVLQRYVSLLEILDLADRFQFKQASHSASKYRDAHDVLLAQFEGEAHDRLNLLRDHWQRLAEETRNEVATRSILLEMICNADRRALQGRWDDALARLYRATELWAQGLGYEALGARLGKIPIQKIPAERQQEFRRTFGEPDRNGVYSFGVKRLVEAVDSYGLPAGRPPAMPIYKTLSGHLQKRNDSILAHGMRPVSQEDYGQLRSALLSGLSIAESDLPSWPRLNFGHPAAGDPHP